MQYHVSTVRDANHELPMEKPRSPGRKWRCHRTAATGSPVNALDTALHQARALLPFYPRLKEMKLLDFKGPRPFRFRRYRQDGLRCPVLIESGDADSTWVTVGVSRMSIINQLAGACGFCRV